MNPKLIFWLSFSFVFYTYLGYPLLLFFQSFFRKKLHVKKELIIPSVSVVISVFNEENRIRARIDNLLAQDYPRLVEVIVVSDGSSDGTCKIIDFYTDKNVKLIDLCDRVGKASALNQGVDAAQGEIVVFADARQRFEPNVISQLVSNFSDGTVGCASGELIFLPDAESTIQAEMGAYWKYEKWTRMAESITGSVVGATGAIYAIRRNLYRPLPPWTLLDDVLTPMNIVMQGFRTVFDGSAIAYDVISKDVRQEWKRKVRTLAGNWQMVGLVPTLLVPWMNSCWLRFLSHKIFRLLVPFSLVFLLISGLTIGEGIYRIANFFQMTVYLLSLLGAVLPVTRKVRLINLIYFFMTMNVAAIIGMWRWLSGACESTWVVTKAKV